MRNAKIRLIRQLAAGVFVAGLGAAPAFAAPFFFSTGNVNGQMAIASRPDSPGNIEIEAADDFVLSSQTRITSTSFTGLLRGDDVTASSVTGIAIEIYRLFPKDSTNPPSGKVPTRVNSPSDVAFDTRDSIGGGLSFTGTTLAASFTAANSVRNGINPLPNQATGGEGAVTGTEVQFNITFSTPFDLPADHYFFVPQVQLDAGDFFWLSSFRPIVPPGTAFTPDLQAWVRNADLDPDWLRVGTDIVGGAPAPTFNAAFTLTGQTPELPEPGSLVLFGAAFLGLVGVRAKRTRHLC